MAVQNDPIRPNAPFDQPLQCDQGANFTLQLTLCNPDANGQPNLASPLNLTGYTFAAQVKERAGKGKLVATITVTPTDLAHGVITLAMSSETTATLVQGDYYYFLSGSIGAAPNDSTLYFLTGGFSIIAH